MIENLNIFKAYREIVRICGSQPKIRPQGDGRLLLEVSSLEQSANLLSMTRFLGHNVRVFPHPIYNQCRGVIYAPELLSIECEEIQSELEEQGVTKVVRMRKKVGTELIPLPTLILSFDSYRLPNSIRAGWLNFKVKPYFPSLLRCYHSQMYGHSIMKCKRKINQNQRCATIVVKVNTESVKRPLHVVEITQHHQTLALDLFLKKECKSQEQWRKYLSGMPRRKF